MNFATCTTIVFVIIGLTKAATNGTDTEEQMETSGPSGDVRDTMDILPSVTPSTGEDDLIINTTSTTATEPITISETSDTTASSLERLTNETETDEQMETSGPSGGVGDTVAISPSVTPGTVEDDSTIIITTTTTATETTRTSETSGVDTTQCIESPVTEQPPQPPPPPPQSTSTTNTSTETTAAPAQLKTTTTSAVEEEALASTNKQPSEDGNSVANFTATASAQTENGLHISTTNMGLTKATTNGTDTEEQMESSGPSGDVGDTMDISPAGDVGDTMAISPSVTPSTVEDDSSIIITTTTTATETKTTSETSAFRVPTSERVIDESTPDAIEVITSLATTLSTERVGHITVPELQHNSTPTLSPKTTSNGSNLIAFQVPIETVSTQPTASVVTDSFAVNLTHSHVVSVALILINIALTC